MPALEKMRVLDMTQYEAGTSCTQALAWLGADVVKVERPLTGDPGRGVARGTDHSPYFLNWNSNKRSIAIDLGSEEGHDILLQMLPNFDVFVENYGPGVIEKLDLDYETMKAVNPRIIHARLKGFGLSGPYSAYKSYDMVAQAAGGAFSVTGEAAGPPMRPGYTVGDSGTGVQLALAITAAYVQQQQTGEGQQVEISMQEAVTYFMRTAIATRSEWGTVAAPRSGNRGGPATDLYPCKSFGPNDYVYIMITTTRMWDSFCTTIGRDDLLTDPRFGYERHRVDHVDELREIIEEWTKQYTKHEVMAILGPAGVPCSASLDTRDLFENPHLIDRDFVRSVEHPVLGEVPLLAWPPRLSASDVEIEAAPMLGQHTDEVLAGELGMTPGQVGDLREAGIVGAIPDPATEKERFSQPSTV